MKPLLLKMQAFGPFNKQQELDFTPAHSIWHVGPAHPLAQEHFPVPSIPSLHVPRPKQTFLIPPGQTWRHLIP